MNYRSDIVEIVKYKGIPADLKKVQQAMQAGYVFDSEGLSIINGNFSIGYQLEDDDYYPLLMASPVFEQIEGTEQYRISGATLTIEGIINSSQGNIGGFSIKEHTISSGQDLILSSSYEEDGSEKESYIYAKNLELGNGAKISDFLALGDFKLLNPLNNNGDVFQAYEDEEVTLRMTQGGTLYLGKNENLIQLSGKESEISGKNWRISPDFASFSNISVSGEIDTAVFKKGSFQNIGSTLLLKDIIEVTDFSYDEQTKKVNFSSSNIYDVGDIFQLTFEGQVAKKVSIFSISKKEENKYESKWVSGDIFAESDIQKALEDKTLILTYFGGRRGTILSISSQQIENSYSSKEGLALTDFYLDSEEIIYSKRLVLGDLSETFYGDKKLSGYGLYADNVYLNGELIGSHTINGARYYAGISSNSQLIKDDSPIIFWAGSTSSNPTSIQEIPFFVTTDGALFASKGHFSGSVLTEATIEAASLKTASIYPRDDNNDDSPVLKIYDMKRNSRNGGISFYTTERYVDETKEESDIDIYSIEEEEIEVLNISSSGFEYKLKEDGQFIQFDKVNQKIAMKANQFQGNSFLTEDFLSVNNLGLFLYSDGSQEKISSYLTFKKEQNNQDSFLLNCNERTILNFDSQQNNIILNEDVVMIKSIRFGEKMLYQKAEKVIQNQNEMIGYDLFIE